MAVHFYELTGVSLKETFLNSLEKKGKRLLDFMRNTCADKSKRVLQAVTKLQILRGQLQGCSEDVKDMVLLLLSYFDETKLRKRRIYFIMLNKHVWDTRSKWKACQ